MFAKSGEQFLLPAGLNKWILLWKNILSEEEDYDAFGLESELDHYVEQFFLKIKKNCLQF